MSKFYNLEGQSVVVESTLSEIAQEGLVDSIKAGVKALKKKVLEILKALLEKVIKWLENADEKEAQLKKDLNAKQKVNDSKAGYTSSGDSLYHVELYDMHMIKELQRTFEDGMQSAAKLYDKFSNGKLVFDKQCNDTFNDINECYDIINDRVSNIESRKVVVELKIADIKYKLADNKQLLRDYKEAIEKLEKLTAKCPEEEKSDELESTKLLRMISKFIPLFTKIVGFLNHNIITLAAYRSSN